MCHYEMIMAAAAAHVVDQFNKLILLVIFVLR